MEDLRTPEQKKYWRGAVNVAWALVIIVCIVVGAITIIRWIWEAAKP